MTLRKTQSAYELGHGRLDSSMEQRIREAMCSYFEQDLGLPHSATLARTALELTNQIPRDICEELLRAGIDVGGRTVLDLGAGMGGLTTMIGSRGGKVIGIEPATGWRTLAGQRVATADVPHACIVGGVGEQLPIASQSIDVIVSLQVLEHVSDPKAVIDEAFRVLKPGGYFYLIYENYLSFWEPHYRVPWLPMLPKAIGAIYLRARGRPTRFLMESITYTTFPAVRRALLQAGFECVRRRTLQESLDSPEKTAAKWRLLKWVARRSPTTALEMAAAVDYVRRAFRTAAVELMQKPRN